MTRSSRSALAVGALAVLLALLASPPSSAQQKKPNILVIFGDDIGYSNISAYNLGMMGYKTPNIDRVAQQGALFTDYYAQQSCTAGRAAFITGQSPFRTGLLKVGLPGAELGLQPQDPTIADLLKGRGYLTFQNGKNHLGDRNEFLPTVHGFDEFFGNFYHLNAEEEPENVDYPKNPAFMAKFGPRGVYKCKATATENPAPPDPRFGPWGKQTCEDTGPLTQKRMETADEEFLAATLADMDSAVKAGKPFFIWHNTTRMHVFTYIPPKYQAMMNSSSNYNIEEAGMAQMDDSIGGILQHLDEIGEADNTIVIFTTDNGAEVFTWPDGGMTPFRATKGTVFEGGFRVPAIIRWPGHVKPGTVENGIFSGLDWLPTLSAAAGNPDITNQLLKGVKLGDRTYKNHLDGFNQMALLTGTGPSARHEIFYFGGPHLGAIRIDDFKFQFYQQPYGWPGEKVTTDMPTIVDLRQDPFERTPSIRGETLNEMGGGYMNEFYAREFWRFVVVQKAVAQLAATAVEYPPMQAPASFNLAAVQAQVQEMIKAHEAQ